MSQTPSAIPPATNSGNASQARTTDNVGHRQTNGLIPCHLIRNSASVIAPSILPVPPATPESALPTPVRFDVSHSQSPARDETTPPAPRNVPTSSSNRETWRE